MAGAEGQGPVFFQTQYKATNITDKHMSEQTYLFLSCCAIFGVILSYIVPIIGGIIEDIAVIMANGLIISIVLKKKFGPQPSNKMKKRIQIVENEDIELQPLGE